MADILIGENIVKKLILLTNLKGSLFLTADRKDQWLSFEMSSQNKSLSYGNIYLM